MLRAFAIAMSAALLATAGLSLYTSEEFSPENAPVAQVENPHNDLELELPEIAAEDLFVEPPLPDSLPQDLLDALPPPRETKVHVTICFAQEPNYFPDPTQTQPHRRVYDGLCLKNGRLTAPPGILRGQSPNELLIPHTYSDSNDVEGRLAQFLLHGSSPVIKLDAAAILWRGHSRYHAALVLRSLPQLAEADPNFAIQVEDDLWPGSIEREIREGDRAWGIWLASLRPHADLVPILIECLKGKPQHRPGIIHALGKSRDERAFGPLLHTLVYDTNEHGGFAALALGELGRPEAEAFLLQALYRHDSWFEMNACRALGKVGTRNAVDRMLELSDPERHPDASVVRYHAQQAIKQIEAREPQ